MADLYRHNAAPLSDRQLFDWHLMLMNGRRHPIAIGAYRRHDDVMQIVSGPLHAPRVHFETPPSPQVPAEMARFVTWFNDSAPQGRAPLPAITRAAIAHLWFETIHPFDDGNGRIGRAIAEKALAQSLEAPTLTALAVTINRHRKAYYTELHRASRSQQIDAWMDWFADTVLAAQAHTIAHIRFVIDKTRLLDRLRGMINGRQEKVLIRMMAEGPDGFDGGLSAHNYQTITGAAPATATRDLADLVALGALKRIGERRYARYRLASPRPNPHPDRTPAPRVFQAASMASQRSIAAKCPGQSGAR
ncbi:Fic family protein [Sphingomonas sp. GC_Shp_1]|uniref:Fic family protein n=1 Tax=unclassified Sphingomonas TaxID=196159 RepID=UPI0031F7F18F